MCCSSHKPFQSKQTNEWTSLDTRVQPFADIYKQGTPVSNCSPTHFITKTITDLNNTWYRGVLDKHCQANLTFYFHLFITIPTLY